MSTLQYLETIVELESREDEMDLEDMKFSDPTMVADSDSSQDDTMAVPHREPSPAPSVYGFTNSMAENVYESKYGRRVNVICRTYSVAADEWEDERQNIIHEVMKQTIGLYIGPVHQLLTRNDGEPKRVYDLGPGGGSWLLEMASIYPSVEFVGLDLVPPEMIHPDLVPSNCRFEIDNVNLPLNHYYNTADFVHSSFMCTGVENYGGLIEQVAHMLKPGGLFMIAEADYKCYRRPSVDSIINPRNRPGHPDYSAYAFWLQLMVKAVQKRGGDTQAALMARIWLNQHRAFDEVAYLEVFIPTGSYYADDTPEGRHWNRIGPLMQESILRFMNSARPLLRDTHALGAIEDVERRAAHDLRSPVKPLWVKMNVICARRR